MTWIRTIDFDRSSGKLRKLYDRVKDKNHQIDRILMAHSLRPGTLQGHMTLYKNVLHHSDNHLPKWLLEALGLYVSLLNQCDYCVAHHFEGMKRLMGDPLRADEVRTALSEDCPEKAFEGKALVLCQYARVLTRNPASVDKRWMAALRSHGLDDGEILEANQVIAYFAYANRTVLGLGVNTEGETLGHSPGNSESTNNWQHT